MMHKIRGDRDSGYFCKNCKVNFSIKDDWTTVCNFKPMTRMPFGKLGKIDALILKIGHDYGQHNRYPIPFDRIHHALLEAYELGKQDAKKRNKDVE